MTKGMTMIWVGLLLYKREMFTIKIIITITTINSYINNINNNNNNRNKNYNNNKMNRIMTLTNSATCSHKRWVSHLYHNSKINNHNNSNITKSNNLNNNNNNNNNHNRNNFNNNNNNKTLLVIMSYQTSQTINSNRISHSLLWTHRQCHKIMITMMIIIK